MSFARRQLRRNILSVEHAGKAIVVGAIGFAITAPLVKTKWNVVAGDQGRFDHFTSVTIKRAGNALRISSGPIQARRFKIARCCCPIAVRFRRFGAHNIEMRKGGSNRADRHPRAAMATIVLRYWRVSTRFVSEQRMKLICNSRHRACQVCSQLILHDRGRWPLPTARPANDMQQRQLLRGTYLWDRWHPIMRPQ